MKRKIKAAHFGIGRMGSIMVKYALDHGVEYVAAFSHNRGQIGQDLGTVAGAGALGVPVTDIEKAESVLLETKPDIALISTQGSMALNKPIYELCAKCHVNAISIGEWCLYPYTADPGIAEELDRLAKENGVTLSASGCPEVAWGTMVTTLCAAGNSITKIHGDCMLNVDDYGPSVSDMHGVDLSPEEFLAHFGPETDMLDGHFPCAPGDQNAFLADHLGLHITRQVMRHVPIYSDRDVFCRNRGTTVKAGRAIGDYMAIISDTEEGIAIEFFVGGKVYADGDKDWIKWDIEGEPGFQLTLSEPDTARITAATPVHRIPDVLNAEPGFVVGAKLPVNTFKSRPLNEYVVEKE